jgi:hypothetical protein
MHHRNVKHGFAGVSTIRLVLAQPSIHSKAAARPFHPPSFGQDDEAWDRLGTFAQLQAPLPLAAPHPTPVARAPAEAPAAPRQRRRVNPCRRRGHHCLAPARSCPLAAVPTTAMSLPSVAPRIGCLRPLTFWALSHPWSPPRAVVLTDCAALSAALGAGGGLRAPGEVAPQHLVEPLPGTVFKPAPKVGIDQAPRRHIVGDKPPRTAGAQALQDRIDHFPLGLLLWSPAGLGSRNQWGEQLPCRSIESGWVGLSGWHTAILSQQINPSPTFFDTL